MRHGETKNKTKYIRHCCGSHFEPLWTSRKPCEPCSRLLTSIFPCHTSPKQSLQGWGRLRRGSGRVTTGGSAICCLHSHLYSGFCSLPHRIMICCTGDLGQIHRNPNGVELSKARSPLFGSTSLTWRLGRQKIWDWRASHLSGRSAGVGLEFRALCMLGRWFTTELYLSPKQSVVNKASK